MPVDAITRDDQSAEFFQGTQRGELLLRHCLDCGHWCAPQEQSCTACHSPALEWRPSSGRGQIVTFAVVHSRRNPPTRTPVAVVEVDEGPWLQTQIVNADPDSVQIGDRVTVAFERPDGGEAVPVFRPAV